METTPAHIRPCTWEGCPARAVKPKHDKQNRIWADLCLEHNTEFERAMTLGAPGRVLSTWVKAQGGAAKAAERVRR